MKLLVSLICLLISITLFAEEEKEDIVQKKYRGQINIEQARHKKAMDKIYKAMLKDYEALLKKHMKSGKLEEATEIKKKIAEVKALSSVSMVGKWEMLTGRKTICEFTKDGKFKRTLLDGKFNTKGTWKINGKKCFVQCTNGLVFEIEMKGEPFKGTWKSSSDTGSFTLSRIKPEIGGVPKAPK